MSPSPLIWKPDWSTAQSAFTRWWKREGMAIFLTANSPAPRPVEPAPARPDELVQAWIDPVYRRRQAEHDLSRKHFLAEAFPIFDTQIGPGSLSTFLGARPEFAIDTVWYWPCIQDPDSCGPIRLTAGNNPWLDAHLALIDEGIRHAGGRYLVGIPDLIENLDTLASLRGDTPVLLDLIERPGWVSEKISEINQAYFAAFDLIYERVKDEQGGCVFGPFMIWGLGKTAKLQCDISATISARMFRKFVLPALQEQVRWLDNSLYHLDGTTCLQHVDALLEIDGLNAIEWTPQAGKPGGGSAEWFDLYRRIKAGGKGIQCVAVEDDEVLPLLDAVGPEGVYIVLNERERTLDQAEALLKSIESYRR
jgi:hypothetical protein